jgi:hypothetical protein
MEVSFQLHVPAALPARKKPLVPNGYEAEWDQEPLLDVVEKRIYCSCQEWNPNFLTSQPTSH